MSSAEKFRILLIGDFSYGESYPSGGARIIKEHGYAYSTEKLVPFVKACDEFVLNLETPLVGDADLQSEMRGKRRRPHWADPEATGEALVSLGVGAVSLANNHVVDQGEQGLRDSLDNLASLGIKTFGAGRTVEEAEAPLVITLPDRVGGGQINLQAALEYRRDYDSRGLYASKSLPGNAALKEDSVPLPNRTPDTFNVALPHWGRYYNWVGRRQQNTARELVSAGYDLVVGTGPHTVQEIAREDSRWIVYSIGNGNFQSVGRWKEYATKTGILPFGFWAVLEVSAPEEGNRRVALNLYPVFSNNLESDYQPGPVDKAAFDRVVRVLTERAVPPGSFPTGGVRLSRDDLGYFIRLELADWPIGQAPVAVSADALEEVETLLVRVIGPRVQHVGFGKELRRRAAELGVVGWVRNRGDQLESIIQGPRPAIRLMTEAVKRGSPRTAIDRVEISAVPTIQASRFRIRRDAQEIRPSMSARADQVELMQDGVSMSMMLPSIGEVLGETKYLGYRYVGDLSARFGGLDTFIGRETSGRFYLLMDDSWNRRLRARHSTKAKGPVKERIRKAISRGASGFVVGAQLYTADLAAQLSGQNVLVADDTHALVLGIVDAVRRLNPECRLTTVTGSAGKSTTQQMLAHVLRSLFPGEVLATGHNRNFYEQSLTQMSRLIGYRHAILEVGHGSLRIQRELDLGFPSDVSIVTAISEAHLQGEKTLENIARLKSVIFKSPPPGGLAVINLDSPHSDLLVRGAYRAGREVITYGESDAAAICLSQYDPDASRVSARIGDEIYEYELGAPGRHNALNSLAVLATLRAYRVDRIEEALAAFATFTPVHGRGSSIGLSFGPDLSVRVVDEAFNANPASVRAAVAAFVAPRKEHGRRRVVLLGDILELGAASPEIHAALAPDIVEANPDAILLFGAEMAALSEALQASGVRHEYRATLDELVGELPSLLEDDDLVLAKASHGTGLYDWIQEQAQAQNRGKS